MQYIHNIPVWGDPVDESALQQIIRCMNTAEKGALMGDHHKGYAVPIGGVLAYKDHISPSGVGYDIACGNKAVLLDAKGAELRNDLAAILDEITRVISFGIGQKNNTRVDHELFDDDAWRLQPAKAIKDKARRQLGTVGSGNHYVDIFVDELDRVWVGVHFGSRGLGHTIASYYLKQGGAKDAMDVAPLVIPTTSALGADYLESMRLAGLYAYAGRDWVCDAVAQIIGAPILESVHNHHNFAWKERHGDDEYWVVRKGATPAFPGQQGFVGGSMGDISVILEGVESEESRTALYSTVHGAGRVMSRTKARGKVHFRTGKQLSEGLISRAMMMEWVRSAGVELRGAGTDESPHCYKRLPDVLEHHSTTIRIIHTLTPIGVVMAGDEIDDPYKD